MNHSYILQIGTATPDQCLSQKEIALHMGKMLDYDVQQTKRLVRLYKKSAIDYRHIVIKLESTDEQEPENIATASTARRMQIYEENACQLAMRAIHDGIDPNYLTKITHLITVSCTGMYAPGLDIELIGVLNLNSNIERTCVNFMGCYGVFNALKLADNICRQNLKAYVLIVSVELCSIHFQPMDSMDNLIANAIFADGAACALVHSHPIHNNNLLLKSFRCELAYERQAMAWYIRDRGFDIRLSNYVPSILAGHVKPLTEHLLSHLQLTANEIDYFAIHPGGKEILAAVELSLAINVERNQQAHDVLKNFGNMSSATILFVLKKLLVSLTKANHENKVLTMAFGPGLTIESALLETHCF